MRSSVTGPGAPEILAGVGFTIVTDLWKVEYIQRDQCLWCQPTLHVSKHSRTNRSFLSKCLLTQFPWYVNQEFDAAADLDPVQTPQQCSTANTPPPPTTTKWSIGSLQHLFWNHSGVYQMARGCLLHRILLSPLIYQTIALHVAPQ